MTNTVPAVAVAYKFRIIDNKNVVRQRGKLPRIGADVAARSVAYLALAQSIPRPETGWKVQVVTDDGRGGTFDVRRVTAYHVDLVAS